MATVTENDLKRVEDLITKGFDEIKQEIRELDIKVTKIEAKLSTMEPTYQKLPELFEKIGELKNWKTITVGVIALIIGLFLRSIYNQ